MNQNAKQRQDILETLYAERQTHAGKAKSGWVSEYDLKNAHGDIAFAMDVLIEIGQVKRDGSRYLITGAGVLACEAARP